MSEEKYILIFPSSSLPLSFFAIIVIFFFFSLCALPQCLIVSDGCDTHDRTITYSIHRQLCDDCFWLSSCAQYIVSVVQSVICECLCPGHNVYDGQKTNNSFESDTNSTYLPKMVLNIVLHEKCNWIGWCWCWCLQNSLCSGSFHASSCVRRILLIILCTTTTHTHTYPPTLHKQPILHFEFPAAHKFDRRGTA